LEAAANASVDEPLSISLGGYDSAIADAYRRLFPDDPDKSDELLDWRFYRNPHGRAKFASASSADGVLGMIALVPTRLRNLAGGRLGYQAIDTSVHHSCRGRGLFVKMGALAQDPEALGGDVLWGFPNGNAAPGWYGRLGWTNFGPAPLLMRPLRSSFILGRIHPKLRRIDLPLIGHSQIDAQFYSDPTQLAADFDSLWERVGPDFGIAVDRSGAWMRWRLFDKPGADYRCTGVRKGSNLEAFLAVKVTDKHGGRLCYVMEAISTPERSVDLVRLLRAELGRAASLGAEAALAWCPRSAPNYRAYRRAGFLPVPPRIRPIEIHFGARALRAEIAAAAGTRDNWYVSFLDSDTN
jgi:hypothetical protein